jgi:hypothetical protein
MPDEPGAGFKYGALIFSPPMGPDEPHSMGEGKETLTGKITSLIPPSELEHWREWLGSVAWRKIERAGRIVVVRASTAAPSIVDADNERLGGEAFRAWRAFLLTEGAANAGGSAWIISGQAAGDQPCSSLLDVWRPALRNRCHQ